MFSLLDLFCGEGGAGAGYAASGFSIVGIDNRRQKKYPFKFIQADALEYLKEHGKNFNVVHASPPCQKYSFLTPHAARTKHPDIINETRAALIENGKPYIIENVPGARHLLKNPLMLCGTMFFLKIRRHRFFEIYPRIAPPILFCDHSFNPVLLSGVSRLKGIRQEHKAKYCRSAAGLPWLSRKGLDNAIPPAYTEFIGKEIIKLLEKGK